MIRTPRGPVEYVVSGQGPAILALHGGMGGYDQGLLLARAALTDVDRFRVVSVSRPGYLGTPLGSGTTPEEQADLCADLLDRLGVSRCFVIAVSAGGPCALEFSARHPSRCAGVILVSACTGHLVTPPEVAARLPVMKLLIRLPWLTAIMRWNADRNPSRAASRSILDKAVRTHPQAGPLMRQLQSSALARPGQRLPGTLNDMAQFSGIAPLPLADIQAPILVVHGTGDRIVPVEHGKRVMEGAPNAELMAIGGGEHVIIFTHLDEIRGRIRTFIYDHAASMNVNMLLT